MRVGYVVLYVNDAEACRRFWIEQVGMVEKRRNQAGPFSIVQVGFADQAFGFELVPLELGAGSRGRAAGAACGQPRQLGGQGKPAIRLVVQRLAAGRAKGRWTPDTAGFRGAATHHRAVLAGGAAIHRD